MKSSFEPQPLPGAAPGFVARDLGIASPPERATLTAGLVSPPEVPSPAVEEHAREEETEAHARALQALQEAVATFDAALATAREGIALEQRTWLEAALDLSVALAERILERELTLDPEALHPLIERAVDLVGDGGPLTIALPAPTYALLEEEMPGRLEAIERDRAVSFRPDAALAVGEARLNAGPAEVEVGVANLLAQLRDELREVWHVDARPLETPESEPS